MKVVVVLGSLTQHCCLLGLSSCTVVHVRFDPRHSVVFITGSRKVTDGA